MAFSNKALLQAAVVVALLLALALPAYAEEGEGKSLIKHKEGEVIDLETKCKEEEAAEEEEVAKEKASRFTIVLGTACLALTFLSGYVMERLHFPWLPEAGCGVLIGIGAGVVMKFTHSEDKAMEMVQFDPEFFFIFLLPPIIFEAGYNMKRQAFFRNIGGICLFAFLGTTVSTFLVGGMVYGAGQMGICSELGLLASLVFGALISATDPVTVLAVFQKVHADVDLYSLVFGESVLNDAVAIVLYRTLIVFKCTPLTFASLCSGFGSFLYIFCGSIVVGMLFAFISALIFKHTVMYHEEEFLFLEMCLLTTFPYMSFMFAEGLRLSGIVSILFCGIGMSHYTYNNLSPEGQKLSRQFFKMVAQLAETFVFVYLGLATFTFRQALAGNGIMLILVAFVACLIARLANVYPNAFIANKFRSEETQIDKRFQFVMWYSGLRGAVAFVIAVTSYVNNDFGKEQSTAILTTTLFIAMITIFAFGGTIEYFINKLDVKEKEVAEDQGAYPEHATGLMVRDKSKPMPESASRAIGVDRKYLKPVFTRYVHTEPVVSAA